MPERSEILNTCHQWLSERWHKGRLTLEDVRALKVLAETYTLTAEEHEAVAAKVGIDRRELMDENNQLFLDWLRARRQALPPGSAALHFEPAPRTAPWKLRLPAPPAAWQNAAAGVAVTMIVIALIVLIAVR